MEELLVSSLVQTDALAKMLIEKGLITRLHFRCVLFMDRKKSFALSVQVGLQLSFTPRRSFEVFPQCMHTQTLFSGA